MNDFMDSFFNELEKIAEDEATKSFSPPKLPEVGSSNSTMGDFMKKHKRSILMVADDFIPIILKGLRHG